MTAHELLTSFDFDGDLVVGGGLDAVAAAIATHAAAGPHPGIVVVVRPGTDRLEVVSGGVDSALRAAVSVVAAAGSTRLWDRAELGEIVQIPTGAFPEVLRAAADGAGVTSAQVGIVGADDAVDAVAIWFAGDDVPPVDDRHAALRMLTAAAERDAARAAEEAARRAVLDDVAPSWNRRTFDPDDPTLDPVTGLANAAAFDDILVAFDADEAVVIVLQIDESDDLDGDLDDVLRVVADRLCAATRTGDVIASVGEDRFAILIGGIERHDAMLVARRLHQTIAEPISVANATVELSTTVALAHEASLPDAEELFDAALDALVQSHRAGPGRFVLAA
jgi:diguanylate cyclase (GGDEF)-like protein